MQHNPVILCNRIINGVLRVRKCAAKFSFETFQFGAIHIADTQVADVTMSDELIEAAGEPRVGEGDPATLGIILCRKRTAFDWETGDLLHYLEGTLAILKEIVAIWVVNLPNEKLEI